MTAAATPSTPSTAGTQGPPAWAAQLLAGAAIFILMDILRVLLPSIAFIFGRAGSTPASEMGLFAFLIFATAGLASRASGIEARIATPIAVLAVGAARIAVVAAPGGTSQLLSSSVGFVACAALLGALAASNISVREAARGMALGVLVSTTVHTLLGTHDSIWIGDGIDWLVTVTAVIALLFAWTQVRPSSARPEVRTTIPWLIVVPVLGLIGIAAGSPGAIRSGFGEGLVGPSVLLVASSAGGYVAGRFATARLRELSGVPVLVPAALCALMLIGSSSPGQAAVASMLSAFVATLALTVSGEAQDDSLASRGRRSAAPAGGIIFTFLVVFGYYASYELDIGFPNGLLPAAAAALIGLVLYQFEAEERHDPVPTREDIMTIAFAPFLVLFVVMASQARVQPAPFDASLSDVRVVTWNVHMGYDDQGQFNPNRIAQIIGQQRPDVVVLNEIDRGWMLSGGHDLLTILADQLQLDYTFAPAADAIWGNAILSRHPIIDPVVTVLPGDAPMDRSMLQAELEIGGQRLGIIATHLHHLEDGGEIRAVQVAAVAAAAQELQLRNLRVVIAGDFNLPPGAPEFAPLSDYVDLPALAGGGSAPPTYPATGPTERIDHIFGSRGVTATDLTVPDSTASDHLLVAVTIDAS